MLRKPDFRVPRLIVVNWIVGMGFGALFAATLLWLDVAGLGGLIWRSESQSAALFLLFGGFAVTFGSAVSGTAIMLMGDSSAVPDKA